MEESTEFPDRYWFSDSSLKTSFPEKNRLFVGGTAVGVRIMHGLLTADAGFLGG